MGVRVRSVNNKALFSDCFAKARSDGHIYFQLLHRDPGGNTFNFQAMWASEKVVSMKSRTSPGDARRDTL